MDTKEKIVVDVKFLMESFNMGFLFVIKDGAEFYVIKKIAITIVQVMVIVKMEFVTVITHIVETTVS